MNTKYIPIAAFLVWSLICWRWYTCSIKEQCGTAVVAAIPVIQIPEPVVIDTTGQAAAQRAIETDNTASKPTSTTPSVPAQSKLTDDIGSTQIVAVADRVLIHFPYGSTRQVDDNAIDAYLSDLAQSLVASGGKVSLTGHTDAVGEPASNQSMALQRAKHIKAILVKKGVNAKQVQCYTKGETKPLATNDNPQGRYRNRRVEVRIQK